MRTLAVWVGGLIGVFLLGFIAWDLFKHGGVSSSSGAPVPQTSASPNTSNISLYVPINNATTSTNTNAPEVNTAIAT